MTKLLCLGLLLLSSFVHALTPPDSISVQNNNGKRLIIHKVESSESYESLSTRYGVPVSSVIDFNKGVRLSPGSIVKIPTNIPFSSSQPTNPSYKAGSSVKGQNIPEPHIINHTVVKGENLNIIANQYNTTVSAIRVANNIRGSRLRIGQILEIETTNNLPPPEVSGAQPVSTQAQLNTDSVKKYTPSSRPVAVSQPYKAAVYHIVKGNETIYSIATAYGINMNDLKALNHLENGIISIGQRLLISPATGQIPNAAGTDENIESLKDPRLRMPAKRYGLHELEEKGVAVWIEDQELDGTKMFALHRTAPLGTVIKVTNPMTNQTTFAKVVGRFTENATTKDVVVVLTKAVAESLGALDKRFFCTIAYAIPDEDQ